MKQPLVYDNDQDQWINQNNEQMAAARRQLESGQVRPEQPYSQYGSTGGADHNLFNKSSAGVRQQQVPSAQRQVCQCCVNKMKPNQRYGMVCWLGICLFILASLYCLYRIYDMAHSQPPAGSQFTAELKLVNVFTRHGDRAPSNKLFNGDPHGRNVSLFWPHGLNNLTDLGHLRMHRLGLELRRRYSHFLSYDPQQVVAFSSNFVRCQQSLNDTLMGLFNNLWLVEDGRQLAIDYMNRQAPTRSPEACHSLANLPTGSGSPDAWRQVQLDLETIPSLAYTYLNNCPFRRSHPSPVDANLSASAAIGELPDIETLANLFMERYHLKFNFTALALWSNTAAELRLVRTQATLAYGRHLFDWVNRPLAGYKSSAQIQLFDLFEQVSVFAYRDRIVGEADYIQLAPIISSLVQSQLVALNWPGPSYRPEVAGKFRDKRLVIYSSHDSILQLLLHRLAIIDLNGESFERRFRKFRRADDETKFLAGFKMSEFGMSLAVELWEAKRELADDEAAMGARSGGAGNRFAYLQAALYNRRDGVHQPVGYKRVGLGSACRRLFRRLHPTASLKRFYSADFPIDDHQSCPFELFLNVTGQYVYDSEKFAKWC